MYNLLLVDDEKRVLKAIYEIIPWEELNVQVVGMCDNAISALQLMADERVDILVTDIKMPIVSGLELIRRARDMYSNIECIILSGYEEFDLARDAIACGVHRYLVKPCSREELVDSIQSCVNSICRERSFPYEELALRNQLIEQVYDKFLKLQLWGLKPQEQINRVLACSKDISVLRAATVMFVTQNEQIYKEVHPIMKKIMQVQDSQEMVFLIVQLLLLRSEGRWMGDPLVARCVKYIYDHYDMPSLTLQYMADNEIHLTARYIGQRFLAEMNMKFSDFLFKVRMEKAIELLRRNDISSATEIAERVGLGNNVYYFYRLFQQYTGLTLKEYKEKNKISIGD